MKNTKNVVVSAVYDEKSGMLQRTLQNDVTVSVLFGGLGTPRNGKKGLYLEIPNPMNLIGITLPFTVYNSGNVINGTIEFNDYCANETQCNAAKEIGVEYVVGSYNVTLRVGRANITKNLKHHDLVTLWCLATDCAKLAAKEMTLQCFVDENRSIA